MGSDVKSDKTDVALKSRPVPKDPPLFKVLIHNDDYSTMEFVVHVLESVFHKSTAEATRIMLNVHHKGIGLCGVYPCEIAETKVDKVHSMAAKAGYPLRCSIDKA